MSAIDQKEYLKRYLSLGDEKEKNKKRKKRAKAMQNRVKIIDDDIDLPRNVNEHEMREFLTAEDAPQIVGIVDDRPLHMRIDDYRKSDKWKLVGSDDELKDDSKTKASYSKQSDSDASPPRKTKASRNDRSPLRFDFKKEKKDRRHSDSDPSPPRKNRRRSSSDPSPPRRNRRKSSSDPSPPRKTRKQSDSTSPPRQSRKQIDNSPPRRTRKQTDLDASPPRKSRKQSDSDTSPPRRSRKQIDNSPPRKTRKQSDSDASPPRKSRQEIVNSPPRKSRQEIVNSPPRKSRQEIVTSPPRKSRKEVDSSPLRKNIKNSNSESKVRKSRWGSASKSPPRVSKIAIDSKRSHSHETSNKMTKTLDGKTAGIQFSGDLKKETAALKKREEDMFKNMSAEISGKNAAPIMRDRKTGKRRDLEKEAMEEMEKQKVLNERKEKYDKWGKGLKQVEDHKQKVEQDLYEMTKPLARYADDEDLEKYLKEQEREGDPMLQYIRKKKRKEAVASGRPIDSKPQYEGEFMPNRYGIPPGHRWDGVDRSNGYEKQWFKVQNDKKAVQEDIYKWSTEDM